jgi:hypothetical protein
MAFPPTVDGTVQTKAAMLLSLIRTKKKIVPIEAGVWHKQFE